MAGSVSFSKPNGSEASLEPQLFRKSVREFRLKITREVRMNQLRLENPNSDVQSFPYVVFFSSMDNHGRICCAIFWIISVFWPGYGQKTVF